MTINSNKLNYLYIAIPLLYLILGKQIIASLGLVSGLDLLITYKWGFVLLFITGAMHLKKLADIGLTNKVNLSLIKLYWPFVLLISYQFFKIEEFPDNELIFKLGLLALAVGLIEEIFFRGILLYWFRTLSYWQQVVYSATIFSLAHSLNLLSGLDIAIAALHLFAAFTIGLLLAILRLKDESLLLVVITHSLINYSDFLFNGARGERLLTTQMFLEWTIPSVIFLAWSIYLYVENARNKIGHITMNG